MTTLTLELTPHNIAKLNPTRINGVLYHTIDGTLYQVIDCYHCNERKVWVHTVTLCNDVMVNMEVQYIDLQNTVSNLLGNKRIVMVSMVICGLAGLIAGLLL